MPSGNLIAPGEWQGGRGLVSNQTSHETEPAAFVEYVDIINEINGRRRKRPGIGVPVDNSAAASEITNMHSFLRTDPSTGAQTWTMLRGVGTTLSLWNGMGWAACALGGLGAFTGSAWRFANFRNRAYIVNGADGLFFYDGTTGPDGREIYRAGIASPAASIGYSLSAVDSPYSTGTVSVTKGAKLVVGSGATTWVTSGAWDDKYIDIAGVRYQIDSVTVASPGQLLLTEEYRGSTATGLTYTIYIGLMDWSEPPQYAYGYKNNTSGHTSNVGPLLQLLEKDVVGRTVRITGIPYSPTDYNNGYDKIQIYRSAKNGTVLVAIDPASGGLINNSSGAGTTTFTETANTYRDVNLTKFPAPIVSNERPLNNAGTGVAALSAIAEWDGRLWAIAPRDAKIMYSGSIPEIEFGRAEECWPAINFLPIDDGRGLLSVGGDEISDNTSYLLIQTGAADRYILGNDVRDYRAPKLRGGRSVGSYALNAISIDGDLVQFYADKRLIVRGGMQSAPDGDIGRPIQDRLNAIPDLYITKVRLCWYSFSKRSLILLSVPKAGATANNVTYVYDVDSSCWYEWSIGFSALAVATRLAPSTLELWGARASNAKVYNLLQSGVYTDDGANFTPVMRSCWMRPFGYGKAALWKWLRLYVGDPAATWQLNIRLDEDTTGEVFTLLPPDFRFQLGNGMLYQPNQNQHKRGEQHQVEVIWPTTSTDQWIDKLRCTWNLDQDVEETI